MVGAFHHATGRDLPRAPALKVFEAMQRRPVFRELLASLTAHPEWTLADAYTDYRRRIAVDSGYVRTWNELSALDRAVLGLIADGETSPYAQPVLKRLGAIVGQDPPSAHHVMSKYSNEPFARCKVN